MNYETESKLKQEARDLMQVALTEVSCERVVEIIKIIGEICSDDEVAHSLEDHLREKVLETIDSPLAKIALKTSDFDFSRWCA